MDKDSRHASTDIEPAIEQTEPLKLKRRLSLDVPLIPPAGRRIIDLTNEELYELIQFP